MTFTIILSDSKFPWPFEIVRIVSLPDGNWDENHSDRVVSAFGLCRVDVIGWADVTDGLGCLSFTDTGSSVCNWTVFGFGVSD
jgi:hypothetical protein